MKSICLLFERAGGERTWNVSIPNGINRPHEHVTSAATITFFNQPNTDAGEITIVIEPDDESSYDFFLEQVKDHCCWEYDKPMSHWDVNITSETQSGDTIYIYHSRGQGLPEHRVAAAKYRVSDLKSRKTSFPPARQCFRGHGLPLRRMSRQWGMKS